MQSQGHFHQSVVAPRPVDEDRLPPPAYQTSTSTPFQFPARIDSLKNDNQRCSPRPNRTTGQTTISKGNTVECTRGLGIGHVLAEPQGPHIDQSYTENLKPSTNVAQKIERKLWQCSVSGGIITRWILEIVSCCLSTLCMAAFIAILAHLQNKPSPSWPFSQTLNMLSRVSSAALILPVSEALGQLKWNWFQAKSKTMWDFEIFDNASRGPWGSALLLVRTKGRTLASLGAAVTVLALAMDPFFQQASDIRERWTAAGNGSLQIVTYYSPRNNRVFGPTSDADLATVDSIFSDIASTFTFENGSQPVLLGNISRPEIPISCPSRNCTWEEYDTLGVCSACADISELLTFGCHTTEVDWTSNLDGYYDSIRPVWSPIAYAKGKSCGYFLNATTRNPVLMSGYLLDSSNLSLSRPGETLLMRTMPLVSTPMKDTIYDGSINFRHIRNPLANFIVSGAADGTIASVYRNETPVCHECVLHWCVKRIRSSYYHGHYQEDVVKTFANTTPGSFPWKVDTTGLSNPVGQQTLMTNYLEDVIIEVPDSPTSTSFTLNNITHFKAVNSFDSIFPSFYTQSNTSDVNIPLLRSSNYKKFSQTSELMGNPWIPPGNVSSHVARYVSALSNALRGTTNQPFLGTSYNIERYVYVEWPWLIFPTVILCMTLVFLVATIRKTGGREGQVGVWKSSAMATLVYGGISEDIRQQMRNSECRGTPRMRARKMKARLLPNKGWRLSGKFPTAIPQARTK